jgi:hypothetical protein
MPETHIRDSGLHLTLSGTRRDWVEWKYQSGMGWGASGIIRPSDDDVLWEVTGAPQASTWQWTDEERSTFQRTVEALEQMIQLAEKRSADARDQIYALFG